MGFLTELFSRPRPDDVNATPMAVAMVSSLSGACRISTCTSPADFPRPTRRRPNRSGRAVRF